MEETQTEQNADFLKDNKKKPAVRFYRKIFLLVFSMALLWQGILLVDNYAREYYAQLHHSFKMILTLKEKTSDEEQERLADQLRHQEGVKNLTAFNSSAAFIALRRQNPQLADAMLLLGTHKMPAYLEMQPNEKVLADLQPFVDNLSVKYPQLQVHYNQEHARLSANAGLFCKMLRLVEMIALSVLVLFMFLVEAANSRTMHAGAGVFSGILGAAVAGAVVAGILYLTGYLPDIWENLVSAKQQAILLLTGGLLGWTFAKWQKF